MILPPDNSLVLPAGLDQLVLDPTTPPAPGGDITDLLPGWARENLGLPGEALLDAIAAVANFQWARFGQAIARLSTPLLADGLWLDYWGGLLKLPRVANEPDGPYRARLLSPPDRISPNAIQAIVIAETVKYTGVPPAFEEPAVDGIFIAALNSPWDAWIQPGNGRLWANYPGSPCLTPGGYLTPEAAGALFWVILPEAAVFGLSTNFIGSITVAGPFINPTTLPATWVTGDQVFVDFGGQSLASAVISDVEFRRAAGVSWALIIDPNLGVAK